MSSTQKVKIAFLGCGRVAEHYLKLLLEGRFNNIELVACCDLEIEKTKKFCKVTNANAYTSYEEMIDSENFDLLAVLTESGNHYDHTKTALIAGKNVLVEKPVCMIPEQAYELQEIANEKKVMLAAVFQNRFNPAILKLRDGLQKGRFGKIITASIRLRWCRFQDYYEDGWHGTWAI